MGLIINEVCVGNFKDQGVKGIAVNLSVASRGRGFAKMKIKLLTDMGVKKTIQGLGTGGKRIQVTTFRQEIPSIWNSTNVTNQRNG